MSAPPSLTDSEKATLASNYRDELLLQEKIAAIVAQRATIIGDSLQKRREWEKIKEKEKEAFRKAKDMKETEAKKRKSTG